MSSEETTQVLERCSQIKNEPKRRKQAVNLLRKWQRDGLEEELKEERAKVERARIYRGGIDAGLVSLRIRDIERQLEEQSPYLKLTPETKDALSKKERELRSEITQGMMDRESYRRNPPGAVAAHRKWEKANKEKILFWKNLRVQLEPESEDRDLANIEIYRPEKAPGLQVATHMPQAQIPGHHAMTPLAKEHFPEGMGQDVNSALDQARQREASNGDPPPPAPSLLEKVCACGCGKTFVPKNGNQKFFDLSHRFHATQARAKLPEKECFCGCGKMFTPKKQTQKFINAAHKRAYFNKKDRVGERKLRAKAVSAG